MKRLLKTALALGLAFIFFNCAGTMSIPLEPKVGAITPTHPFEQQAVLYIPPDTRNFVYHSPDHIPSYPLINFNFLRPFTLPVGNAVSQGAYQTFSQLFRKISVVPDLPSATPLPLIIEVDLVAFDPRLQYAVFGYRPRDEMVDLEGKIKIRIRLRAEGKSPWEKIYEGPIPAERFDLNYWTEGALGNHIALSLGLLFKNIGYDFIREMSRPEEPLWQWLKR